MGFSVMKTGPSYPQRPAYGHSRHVIGKIFPRRVDFGPAAGADGATLKGRIMERPPLSPLLKQVLELGPIAIFALVYVMMRGETVTLGARDYAGFIVAVAVFTPLQLISVALIKTLSGKVSRMQVATLVLVLVLGGITVGLNDERFFKMKSTFVFGAFGALLFIGLARGQSWLAYLLEGALPITQEGWIILTRRMAWFFIGVAVLNEIIWRNFSTDAYVVWDTLGQMGAMMGFFAANYGLIAAHWQEPEG
jgi:intracellular septation protein